MLSFDVCCFNTMAGGPVALILVLRVIWVDCEVFVLIVFTGYWWFVLIADCVVVTALMV